jgi:hypothetical protein
LALGINNVRAILMFLKDALGDIALRFTNQTRDSRFRCRDSLDAGHRALLKPKPSKISKTPFVNISPIPRHNPVNAFSLGGIVRDAGLTVEQFRELL